jgi:hypothetical protein
MWDSLIYGICDLLTWFNAGGCGIWLYSQWTNYTWFFLPGRQFFYTMKMRCICPYYVPIRKWDIRSILSMNTRKPWLLGHGTRDQNSTIRIATLEWQHLKRLHLKIKRRGRLYGASLYYHISGYFKVWSFLLNFFQFAWIDKGGGEAGED